MDCPSKLYGDASAAFSIAKRQGAGKMRHRNVKSLWLQEKRAHKELGYVKIKAGVGGEVCRNCKSDTWQRQS